MSNNTWQNVTKEQTRDIEPDSVPLKQFFNMTLNGDYVAGGVGLANSSGSGTINFSGQIPSGSLIVKAYLYWINIVPGPNTGLINGTPITGEILGTVAGFYNFLRVDVTNSVLQDTNTLENFTGNPGGAALIIVYQKAGLPQKTVVINDGAEVFFNDTVSTTLQNFIAVGSPPAAKTTYMGIGFDTENNAFFNGNLVDGTPAFSVKSGIVWDTLNIDDVSSYVNQGDTSATAAITNNSDTFLWYIAQAFSVTAQALTRGIPLF